MRSKSNPQKDSDTGRSSKLDRNCDLESGTLPSISEEKLEQFRSYIASTEKLRRAMERQLTISPGFLHRTFTK